MSREFKKIAENIPGAEGPVLDLDGRFFMVAPNDGLLVQVTEGGQVTTHADTGGIPAGCQCDKENNIWIADMRLGVFRVEPDGTVHHEVATFAGEPIRGCNDCAFDGNGNLWITAPGGSGEGKPVGELFCRALDGEVTRIDGGYQFCNGIAVTGDDSTLIIAETPTKSLWAYDIEGPGKAVDKRLWGKLPGDLEGGPDGMDFDEDGNLLATHWGSGAIEVFDPDGNWKESIETPFERPSNVHFVGEDRQTVYVTEHDDNALWSFRWDRPGQAQYCDR